MEGSGYFITIIFIIINCNCKEQDVYCCNGRGRKRGSMICKKEQLQEPSIWKAFLLLYYCGCRPLGQPFNDGLAVAAAFLQLTF